MNKTDAYFEWEEGGDDRDEVQLFPNPKEVSDEGSGESQRLAAGGDELSETEKMLGGEEAKQQKHAQPAQAVAVVAAVVTAAIGAVLLLLLLVTFAVRVRRADSGKSLKAVQVEADDKAINFEKPRQGSDPVSVDL